MTNVFMTGTTGFLGRACLQKLLESKDVSTIDLLIRGSSKIPEPLRDLVRKADQRGKEIRLVVGDIKEKDLGISTEDRKNSARANEVYHFAANVSLGIFSDPNFRRNFYLTNVDGTRNVRDFFLDADCLERFFHCSSAYISGTSNETVPEEWIESPENPRNDYESSKWLAENVMRQSPHGFPLTILRPSILCVDDLMGGIPKQTIYSYINVLSRAIGRATENEQIRIVGEYDSLLNLASLTDFLTFFDKIRRSERKEVIYNMTGENNLRIGEIIDWIGEGLGFEGFKVVDGLEVSSKLSDAESYLSRHTGHFEPYLRGSEGLGWNRDNSVNLGQGFVDVRWMKDHMINYSRSLKNGRK